MLREEWGDAWPVLHVSWPDSLQQRHRTMRAEYEFRLPFAIAVEQSMKLIYFVGILMNKL